MANARFIGLTGAFRSGSKASRSQAIEASYPNTKKPLFLARETPAKNWTSKKFVNCSDPLSACLLSPREAEADRRMCLGCLQFLPTQLFWNKEDTNCRQIRAGNLRPT